MSELVNIYVPITLPQVEALVASAYYELPLLHEPYRGFLNYEEAVEEAKALAERSGIGFLAREGLRPEDAKESVFSFYQLADICMPVPRADLRLWQGACFPYAQVSLAGTPYRGMRVRVPRHLLDDATGDLMEASGFFRFDEIYPEATAWYDPHGFCAWDRLCNALARECHLDDEDASEQGFKCLWKRAQPFLARLENPPRFRYDAWTDDSYFVCLDDTEYLAYRFDELGRQNPDWVYWAFETERLVEVLNLALQAKGIPERCYLSEWGNDSKVLFLTREHHQILTDRGYLRTFS